jgi:hypothetical protein
MDFIEWMTVFLSAGFKALVIGFASYYVVLWTCQQCELHGFWRIGLTLGTVVLVIVPDCWQLAFHADDFRSLMETPFSAEALWLAIKTKLVVGWIGHAAGFFVKKWLFP